MRRTPSLVCLDARCYVSRTLPAPLKVPRWSVPLFLRLVQSPAFQVWGYLAAGRVHVCGAVVWLSEFRDLPDGSLWPAYFGGL